MNSDRSGSNTFFIPVLFGVLLGCAENPDPHSRHGKEILYKIDADVSDSVDRSKLTPVEQEMLASISEKRMQEVSLQSLNRWTEHASWSSVMGPNLTSYSFELNHAVQPDPIDGDSSRVITMSFVICEKCQRVSHAAVSSLGF